MKRLSGGRRRGFEQPRLWTKPLRELTPETSHGFHVIEFARDFLSINLYPWQKWLLIHALELNEDGTYRFDRVIVLVARQNGKTLLLTVLTLWWLFIDSESFPEVLPPREFVVLGTAQNLDIAEEAWEEAVAYCDPDEGKDGSEVELAVPALQKRSMSPKRVNGQKTLRLKNGAKYQVRSAGRKGTRGKSAARIVMDELREQTTYDTWAAITKSKAAKFNSQLWGISNAGDIHSVVLRDQRNILKAAIEDWDTKVESGEMPVEVFADSHSLSHGLFEWSAPDGCAVDDPEGILQANPSCGYSAMSLEGLIADARGEPENIFRTESLCQWVTARVEPFLSEQGWADCRDDGSQIVEDSRLMFAVDISADRSMTYVAVAGFREDGLPHGEVIAARAGSAWLMDFMQQLAESQDCWEVALQPRGANASEFAEPLRDAGFRVVEVGGSLGLGGCCGGFADKVFSGTFRHLGQPVLDAAAAVAQSRRLGEVEVWDRFKSPADISGLVAVAEAVWALEHAAPMYREVLPPAAPGILRRAGDSFSSSGGRDFRTVAF